MTGGLVGAAHADRAAGEVVFQVGVDPFDGTALLIAAVLGRPEADLLLAAGLGEDRRFAGGGAGWRAISGTWPSARLCALISGAS